MRIINPNLSVLLPLLAVLAAGCVTVPATRIDRDPAVDLKAYRTFNFLEPQAPGGEQYTSLVTTRLRDSTRAQLEKLGYVYSEDHPDLKINLVVAIVNRQEVRATPATVRPLYRGWAGYPDISTTNYRQGTLRIDLVDAARSTLVWRGEAEGRLSDKTARDPQATVAVVVNQLFAGFPNGAG